MNHNTKIDQAFRYTDKKDISLKTLLVVEQDVRICNGHSYSSWTKAFITKVNKHSIIVTSESGKDYSFTVSNYGELYETGQARSNYATRLSFDCEGCDEMADYENARKDRTSRANTLVKTIDEKVADLKRFPSEEDLNLLQQVADLLSKLS
mgnify:CR=1 FL=1|tara:strand:- start:623 stop:1075 length:453 start_codon:yes stop_codon:yes gene_type:complete